MTDRRRFPDCPCGYCREPGVISSPDTHGEYIVDEHMACLERALDRCVALLRAVHKDGWVSSGMTLDVEIGDLLYELTGGEVGYPPKPQP